MTILAGRTTPSNRLTGQLLFTGASSEFKATRRVRVNEKYDIVGDIHGHAAKLQRLLRRLGYEHRDGIYRHASRQLVFVGDHTVNPQVCRLPARYPA